MILNRYKSRHGESDDGGDAPYLREHTFERPLPPDSLLRMTEDFSPVYEMAFRPGITDQQARATLRTIERAHRAKMVEMASWSEAMRRAEAEKHRALKRIQDDMEVDQLRAQLKTMKSRLEEKSREITDSSHFLQQVAALRANYEKERGKQLEVIMESPPRGAVTSGRQTAEDPAMFASSRMSTGKKQKLYNALQYSALYDEATHMGGSTSPVLGTSSPSAQHPTETPLLCLQHGRTACPYCTTAASPTDVSSSLTSPSHVFAGGLSTTPTPLKVHERYFHQRPAPSLNYSPAKMQLHPLKTVPVTGAGQEPPVAVVDASSLVDGAPQSQDVTAQKAGPFGIPRKKA